MANTGTRFLTGGPGVWLRRTGGCICAYRGGSFPIPVQPVAQQPVQPVQQQPVQPAPAAVTTAPPPPAQPTTVADYTGLPPGGTYDQSTGQTIYIQPDGVQWQMMGDGSFNRL